MLKPADPGLTHGNPDRSFGDLAHQVLDDGRDYVHAEVELLKVRAASHVLRYRGAAQLAGVALAFAVAAMVALSVAVVIVLAYWLGPVAGGLLAVALFIAGAVGFGMAARKAFERADD